MFFFCSFVFFVFVLSVLLFPSILPGGGGVVPNSSRALALINVCLVDSFTNDRVQLMDIFQISECSNYL